MFYDLEMATYSTDIKRILKNNVEALMRSRYGRENYWKLCQDCGIGPGTGTRIKDAETSVGIEILEKLAKLFDIHPWHLLIPSLDPSNPPVVLISDVEQEFYLKMKAASSLLANNKDSDSGKMAIAHNSNKVDTPKSHTVSVGIKNDIGFLGGGDDEESSKAGRKHQ